MTAITDRKPGRPYRVWTAAELALLGTKSDAKLALDLGCSLCTVATKRKSMGIPSAPPVHNPHQRPVSKLRYKARAMKAKHPIMSLGDIAAKLGVSKQRVAQYLKPVKREETNPDLTAAEVLLDGWEKRDFKYTIYLQHGTREVGTYMTGHPPGTREPGTLVVIFPSEYSAKKGKVVRQKNVRHSVVKLLEEVQGRSGKHWQAQYVK